MFFNLLILQESERILQDSPPGIKASPHEDNLRYFDVTIEGPTQSPYEGTLHLTTSYSSRWPVSFRIISSGRLSDGPTKSPFSDQNLSSKH